MRRLFGGLLLGIGILAGGTSGLCVIFGIVSLSDNPDPLAGSIGEAVLVISGIVLAVGIGLVFLGRNLIRQADANTRSPQDQSDTFR